MKNEKFENMTKEEIEKAIWDALAFIPEDRRQGTIERTIVGMIQ